MKIKQLCLLISCLLIPLFYCGAVETEMVLKNNLNDAKSGDYLVTLQGKNYTVLLIRSVNPSELAIEEITVPTTHLTRKGGFSWKKWIEDGAPKNTGWVMYKISLTSGAMLQAYSYTKNEWISLPPSQSFLSTLLNLKLQKIPASERKRVGPKHPSDSIDRRALWEPSLTLDGKIVPGIIFNGWRARWPKDDSELSGRLIEIYLPKEKGNYPSYFPYWLQVIGMTGKAKVRIVDSGSMELAKF